MRNATVLSEFFSVVVTGVYNERACTCIKKSKEIPSTTKTKKKKKKKTEKVFK